MTYSHDQTHNRPIILILEDEYRVALAIAKILKSLGYTTMIAKTVDRAKEIVIQHMSNINAVVADYGMRGEETGLDFLSWLNTQRPEIIRVLISGLDLQMKHIEIFGSCHYFLEKPFDIQKLKSILNLQNQTNHNLEISIAANEESLG